MLLLGKPTIILGIECQIWNTMASINSNLISWLDNLIILKKFWFQRRRMELMAF